MYEVTFTSAIRDFDGSLEVGSVDPEAPFDLLTADEAPAYLFKTYSEALGEVTAHLGLDFETEVQDEWTEFYALREVVDPETGRVTTLAAAISETIY